MQLNQLSVFLQNRPGQLSDVCRLLAEADINILTLSLADTDQFGILRVVVKDWRRAEQVLERAGNVVKVNAVFAVEIPDRPGALARVLAVLEEKAINIEYLYALTFRPRDRVIIVFRFEDPERALDVLREGGIAVYRSADLYRLADESTAGGGEVLRP